MLEKSCLYASDYIERNKETYYDLLTRVRTHNDMISWIKFFFETVAGIKEGTIKNVINCLLEREIIVETTGYNRNQIFKFQKYTDLFLT